MSLDRQVLLAGMLWLFTVVMNACGERRLPDPGNGRIAITDFFFRCLSQTAVTSIFHRQCSKHAKIQGKSEEKALFPIQVPL